MEKKIILLASSAHSLINFRLDLMRAFLRQGFKVTAMAPFDEKTAAQLARLHIKFVPIPLARNGLNPFKDGLFFLKLFRLIKREQANILFSYTIKPVIYGSLAAKLAGVSAIYSMITGTGYAFSQETRLSRAIGWIARQLFTVTLCFNRKVFFQNPDNAQFFLDQQMISSKEKIALVNGSGVNIDHFKQVALPAQLSFIMIARLLFDKGVREYVEAAKLIKAEFPTTTFKLAGWIDTNPNSISQEELTTWIESGVIDYLGKLEDVRGAIANASVYVLPSYAEGTPRTVLEAMAMNRPIITTTAPGCKETVIAGENGLLVPPRDSLALYQAMKTFVLQPELITPMGTKSRLLAEQKYDVHKVNERILKEMQLIPI